VVCVVCRRPSWHLDVCVTLCIQAVHHVTWMLFSLCSSVLLPHLVFLSAIPLFFSVTLCALLPLNLQLSYVSPFSVSLFCCPAPQPYYLLLHPLVLLSVPVFSIALVCCLSQYSAPYHSLFQSIFLPGVMSLICFLNHSVLPPVFSLSL